MFNVADMLNGGNGVDHRPAAIDVPLVALHGSHWVEIRH